MQERKNRLANEILVIRSLLDKLTDHIITGTIHDVQFLKTSALNIISILSIRVKELRHYSTAKKIAIQNLMKKIEGDWHKSPLCHAISYIQTRLIQTKTCVDKILTCIDDMG